MAKRVTDQGICSAFWYFIQSQSNATNWTTRIADYKKWWEIYLGRQWEQENEKAQESYHWKEIYNETRRAIDRGVALVLSAKPRHYHVNIIPDIIEQKALNIFLTRATADNYNTFVRDSALYGAIYGAAIQRVDIDPLAEPLGYMNPFDTNPNLDERKNILPMPVYSAEPPYQWIFDPSSPDVRKGRYAIHFGLVPIEQAKRIAGRNIADNGFHFASDVVRLLLSRTTAKYRHRESTLAFQPSDDVLAAEIWFADMPIGDPDNPILPAKSYPRKAYIIGDYLVNAEDYDYSRYPLSVYSPMPIPGYQFGQSFVEASWSMQRAINARRARAREIEHWHAGLLAIRGQNAKADRDIVMAQRGSGIVAINSQMEHLRGERIAPEIYYELRATMNDFNEMWGLPPVLQGESEKGVYSGRHAQSLIESAGRVVAWRASELGRSLTAIGNIEWEMLRKIWGKRVAIFLDTGTQPVVISPEVLYHRGWTAETVPEDLYMQIMNSDKQEVAQLFMAGIIPADIFIQRLSSLSPEEKERSLQYLQEKMDAMAAAQAQPAGASAGGGGGE